MLGTRTAQRRLSEGASVKLLVWIVVFFGAYSAYKLMGVCTVENNIERSVADIFEEVDHGTSHDAIKHLIVRRVALASIELDPENIRVETERRPGERLVDVEVAHPVTINFLGSERVLTADLHVSQVISVDEVAVARQAERQRRAEAYIEEVRQALDDRREKGGGIAPSPRPRQPSSGPSGTSDRKPRPRRFALRPECDRLARNRIQRLAHARIRIELAQNGLDVVAQH